MSSIDSFIKQYNLVIDFISPDEILYIKSSISSEEQSLSFIEKLSEVTHTDWKSYYEGYDTDTKKFAFCKAWICEDVHIKLVSNDSIPKYSLLKLEILVKKSQCTERKDSTLLEEPLLASLIRLHLNYHNKCKWYNKRIKVHDNVKEFFFKYFDTGYNTVEAKKAFIDDRQRLVNFKGKHFIPSRKRISYLYALWREKEETMKYVCDDFILGQTKDGNVDPEAAEIGHTIVQNNIIQSSTDAIGLQTFLNTLPHKCSPFKNKCPKKGDAVPDSQSSINFEYHALNEGEISLIDAVKELDNLQENDSGDNILSNNNSNSPPVSVQRQDFSVNTSPNHLNGSIITVNTSDIITFSPSSLNGCQISHVSNPQTSRNSSKLISSPPTISISEPGEISPSKFCIRYDNNLLFAKTSGQNPVYQMTPIQCQDNHSTTSVKGNCVPNFKQVDCSLKSNVSNITNFSYPPINCISILQSPSSCISNFTNKEFSRSTVTTSEKIHITSTAHQSGAYISMTPVCKPSQVVNTIYFPDCHSTVSSLDEPINIKEEPEDISEVSDLKESEKSDMPVIAEVFSLKEENDSTNEELMPLSENNQNGDSESDFKHIHDSSASGGVLLEDDYCFLLSLLPELKQIPGDIKRHLKFDIRNLVASATFVANTRKRKLSES